MPISDGRTLVVTIGKALSLLWLVSVLQLSLYQAKELHPFTRDTDNDVLKSEQETFVNSHILEKELEKSVYLLKGVSQDLIFSLDTGGTMTLAVTPCASQLHWSLVVKRERIERDFKPYRHRKRFPPVQLVDYKNDTRQVFSTNDALEGIYTLSVNSTDSDSYAKFVVTRNTTLHYMYPDLPSDKFVRTRIRKRKMTISWSPSPMAAHLLHPIQYCVSINQIKNFKTHCSALAHKNGDKKPVFEGWGFSTDEKMAKLWKNKARPIRKVKKKHMFYECVMGKTSFTYKKFRKGKKYFVDIFIVDRNTNTSSAYVGTTVEKKKKKKKKRVQKRHYAILNMDKTRTVNLKHTRGVQLNMNQTFKQFVIEVVPCSGERLKLKVKPGQEDWTPMTSVLWWKSLNFTQVTPGTYLIAFPGKRKKSSFVSVSASSDSTTSKVVPPDSMAMTVHSGRTSCSDVTLEWMQSPSTQYYCLYKRVAFEKRKSKGSRRQRCLSPSERPRSEHVFCERRGAPTDRQQSRVFTMRGLAPATTYRFDVYVGNKRSGMIAYQSVKETTRANC